MTIKDLEVIIYNFEDSYISAFFTVGNDAIGIFYNYVEIDDNGKAWISCDYVGSYSRKEKKYTPNEKSSRFDSDALKEYEPIINDAIDRISL